LNLSENAISSDAAGGPEFRLGEKTNLLTRPMVKLELRGLCGYQYFVKSFSE
jgi:alpha-D-ribose 1-methylphosphonate 5-triphosphate synthase subunit PhnG